MTWTGLTRGRGLSSMIADWVHEYAAGCAADVFAAWKRNQMRMLERWERRQAERDAGVALPVNR